VAIEVNPMPTTNDDNAISKKNTINLKMYCLFLAA